MAEPGKRARSFSLVELLTVISILAVLIAGAMFFVANYITWAKSTSDKQTYTILNDALTRFKCEGGNVGMLTSAMPTASVLAAMQTPVTLAGNMSHIFLDAAATYPARSLNGTGNGPQYHFYRYNSYNDGSGPSTGSQTPAIYVALSGGATTACSSDGISWRAGTMPNGNNWCAITTGGGKFVAVAKSTNTAAYSSDGINWTLSTLPSSAGWDAICYGNGMFVTVASGSNKAAYSSDGINWTASTLPQSVNWSTIAYGNSIFYVLANSSGYGAITGNISGGWTQEWPAYNVTYTGTAFGGGVFVTVANGSAAYEATDGTFMATTFIGSSSNWSCVAYGAGEFVSLINGGGGSYTPSGSGWTVSGIASAAWSGVCYGNAGGKFEAVAGGSTTGAYSADGKTWTASTLPSGSAWCAVAGL